MANKANKFEASTDTGSGRSEGKAQVGKFRVGKLFITCGIQMNLVQKDTSYLSWVYRSLSRHAYGDWGELCDEDKRSNEYALKNGDRLFSAYKDAEHGRIWIITEYDRSSTTILLPEEY